MFVNYFVILGTITLFQCYVTPEIQWNKSCHTFILTNKIDQTIRYMKYFIHLHSARTIIWYFNYAVKMQAPPTFLIFSSAIREKNLALTITGCLGKAPLPKTLK